MDIKLYFDGYCPESLLKGERVEMRLNQDDFWESEATGLQISVFPPYAAILRWRGKGKFRESSEVASNVLGDLVMTASLKEPGKEIFPDKEKMIHNIKELECYLGKVFRSQQEFQEFLSKENEQKLESENRLL